jgi:high frequency lysogenization protein
MQPTTFDNKTYPVTLALAGVFQAAALVNQLATTGQCEATAFAASIKSIYRIDAIDVPHIYDGVENLSLGLNEVMAMGGITKSADERRRVERYALGLILLQYKLRYNTPMNEDIKKRLQHLPAQASFFSETHDTLIANLADIYMSTLSKFRYRIHILGKPQFLHNQLNVDKMRALFLAGIRSAVLWHQVGGRRWHLFFSRKRLASMAGAITTQIKQANNGN